MEGNGRMAGTEITRGWERAPVIVGGVGGSGTRLVARLLMDLGLYLGEHLNESNDNLWFTLLLKRPFWYAYAAEHRPEDIAMALRILQKRLSTNEPLSAEEIRAVRLAAGHALEGSQADAERMAGTLIERGHIDFSSYAGWGWKEPNSHIYLPYLDHSFPNFRYIHVMRNGLSMAYSANQQQLQNWGVLFGVHVPKEEALLPKASLQYWIRSHQRIVRFREEVMGERLLLLNYDRLCARPEIELTRLAAFLGVSLPDIGALASRVKPPTSLDRYKREDLSIYDEAELEAVRQLGFEVER